jgi:hypothetical protein
MHSTPAPNETGPHDVFAIDPDVVLAARADKTSANASRASAQPDRSASGVYAAASAPSLDATFRAAAVDPLKGAGGGSARGKWVRRSLVAFLFAFCSAVATEGWKHYGDTARAMAANWAPNFVLNFASPSPPQEQPGVAEQPSAPAVQAAAADQAAAQPAPPAQSAEGVAASGAALPPESAQLLQSMSQQIEQLKASVDQLKASQEQMSRDIARNAEIRNPEARNVDTRPIPVRIAEPAPRPRIPTPPTRLAAAPVHKPKPAFSAAPAAAPLQTAAAPRLPQTAAIPAPQSPPPAQTTAQPDGEPVVRPPMPLH